MSVTDVAVRRVGLLSDTAVVVLNWNGLNDTLRCLAALEPARLAGTRLIVVDNGSTDGSLERLRDIRGLSLIETGCNLGFTGGNNIGLQAALAEDADFICVLNNDTIPSADFLVHLRARVLESATPLAVSPLITREEGTQLWFGGGILDRADGWPRHLQEDEGLDWKAGVSSPYASDLLTGCCLFAKASVWRDVGLFDERYFLIFEDSDWSLRARAAGVSLEVVPISVVDHLVSASFTGAAARLGLYYYSRNLTRLKRERLADIESSGLILQRVIRPALSRMKKRERGALRGLALVVSGVLLSRWQAGAAPGWVQKLSV